MWIMLLLLWLAPLALGLMVLKRAADGMPTLNRHERDLFFDETQKTELSPWLGFKFAALAVVFFIGGLVQGLILPNLGIFWMLAAPLLTGATAILFVALWLRSKSTVKGVFHRRISLTERRAHRIANRIAGMFSR